MEQCGGVSDQFHNWSVRHGNSTDKSAPTPCVVDTTTAVDEAGVSKGLADRALQALWQAWMQMRPGARPWSQILSFSQSFRASTGNDLCTATRGRAGSGLSCESYDGARTIRGDLRDKPGVVKKAGGFLRSCHGACGVTNPHGVCGLFGSRGSGGQHDSGLSVRRIAGKGDRR